MQNVPDDPAYHDIHISIVLSPADSECSGVVVEMTPHYRPAAWSAQLVNQVAAAGLLVRVTGQRMFDSSHTPCISGSPIKGDPARISLWEEISRFSCMLFLSVRGFSDYAGPINHSR